MKKTGLICFAAALTLAGCQTNTDNNKSLDFDTLEVNFAVSTASDDSAGKTLLELPEGATFALEALCTRGEDSSFKMNSGSVSLFKTAASGSSVTLVKASESDAVIAQSSDHNFRFYAVCPAKDAVGESVDVTIPSAQEYSEGVEKYLTYTAFARTTTVIPDITLSAKCPAAVLKLSVPIDIVEEGIPSVLSSIEITPDDESSFSGSLAGEGSVDVETGTFSLKNGSGLKSVKLTFPSGGLKLEAVSTDISIATLPFTIPQSGFAVKFTDISGKSNETAIWSQDSDAGKAVAAGEVTSVTVTRSSDGVVPVTFPVQFPISRVDGKQNFTTALQPKWVSEGYWSCTSQPQAYCQWHQVGIPEKTGIPTQFLEIVNSGNISTGGVKGVWTGDYFEFVIPVKKFAAGTKIQFQAPFYGRQEPVFWYIKYLDGQTWKTCNLHSETCYDDNTAMDCTFSLVRGAKTITETMTFENEVKSGFLKIRVECADGSIQADTMTAVATRECPWIDDKGKYGAPFYFWDNCDSTGGASTGSTPKITSVSFSIVE